MKPSFNPKQAVGLYWEHCAETFLSQKGLKFIACNFSTQCGEIDLIMLDHLHIAFIEVRYRQPSRFGNAGLSITAAKDGERSQGFLQQYPKWRSHPCRFDVIVYDAGGTARTVLASGGLRVNNQRERSRLNRGFLSSHLRFFPKAS